MMRIQTVRIQMALCAPDQNLLPSAWAQSRRLDSRSEDSRHHVDSAFPSRTGSLHVALSALRWYRLLMQDSDPRPMPHVVRRSYRSPLLLKKLFLSDDFYNNVERMSVAKQLFAELSRRYGIPEIEYGSSRKLRRVDSLVKSIKSNSVKIIDLLLGVAEYGGEEVVNPILASLMEPKWVIFWNEDRSDRSAQGLRPRYVFSNAAPIVLSDEQLRWIFAQRCRSFIDGALLAPRDLLLEAVSSAETFSELSAKVFAGLADDEALTAAHSAMQSASLSVARYIRNLRSVEDADPEVAYRAKDPEYSFYASRSKYGGSKDALFAALSCSGSIYDTYDSFGLPNRYDGRGGLESIAGFANKVFSPSLTDKRW